MRLIDADALEKRMEERLNSLRNAYGNYDHYTDGFEEGCVAAEDAETVDAVEVVRCKDCKHFGGIITAYTCRLHSTGNTRIQMREDDFCSRGERRD